MKVSQCSKISRKFPDKTCFASDIKH